MNTEEIQQCFLLQWRQIVLYHGEPEWSGPAWLRLWEDLLWANLCYCRERGATLRQWLRAVRALDTEFIGAEWMVVPPRGRLGSLCD